MPVSRKQIRNDKTQTCTGPYPDWYRGSSHNRLHRLVFQTSCLLIKTTEVQDYRAAISWAAQTALREIIGQMSLADILIGRAKIDADLQKIIDERTTPWGISVQSVEIRDVIIPQGLEDAMSQQAQAERERQSRVILEEGPVPPSRITSSRRRMYVSSQNNGDRNPIDPGRTGLQPVSRAVST